MPNKSGQSNEFSGWWRDQGGTPQVHIDLIGRVRNTKLPFKHGLMPLFEAIVNSIGAIEEAKRSDGRIVIRINRKVDDLDLELSRNVIHDVDELIIEDNGIGFTAANFESFETMDSRAKEFRGGKGIGRLLWLKAFERADVESVYFENNAWWKRTFTFKPTSRGIEKPGLEKMGVDATPLEPLTTVRLIGFRRPYRDSVPKSAEAISRRIVEHCMEYFFLGSCPQIFVEDEDEGEKFELGQLFEEEYSPRSHSRDYESDGVKLSIKDVFLKAGSDALHRVSFCAHNRVVATIPLVGKIPHLDSPLEYEDGSPSTYVGFVNGEFFDERVDAQRTGFYIDREDGLEFDGGPKWERIASDTINCISNLLTPLTREARERSLSRVTSYVEAEAPRYRPLLNYRRDAVASISDSIKDANLDLELHKIYGEWTQEIRRQASESLEQVTKGDKDFRQYSDHFRKTVGVLQEAAQSELAEYVLHRAMVLSFFEHLLGKQGDNRFAKEGALHQIVFPQRKTSNDIDYDEHSLWIIDERLAYHHYLASDIAFNQQNGPIDVGSNDRPDLLIYNQPLAFVPGNDLVSSIVIVEFKRPERDSYSEPKNPVRQVLNYISQLREGKAKRPDGSTIEPVDAPCYCYIIATLTPNLIKEVTDFFDFTPTPDRMGYFYYHSKQKAYIELISYRKTLNDAKKRNRAFFDKLHMRT